MSGNIDSGGDARGGSRPARNDSTPRHVLEEILRQTQLSNEEQPCEPGDVESLLEVARKHRGAAFELRPVAQELVQAALRRRLGAGAPSEDQLAEMSEQVARTMLENPETQARLQLLWERLVAIA